MWRAIERELVDILKAHGVDLSYEAGDTLLIDNNRDVIFSVTELAKELMRRGIGQGTPR